MNDKGRLGDVWIRCKIKRQFSIIFHGIFCWQMGFPFNHGAGKSASNIGTFVMQIILFSWILLEIV